MGPSSVWHRLLNEYFVRLRCRQISFLLETRRESFMMFWIRSWQKLECSHSAEFCPPILYRPQTLGMEGKSCKAASCIPKKKHESWSSRSLPSNSDTAARQRKGRTINGQPMSQCRRVTTEGGADRNMRRESRQNVKCGTITPCHGIEFPHGPSGHVCLNVRMGISTENR